MNRFSEKSNFLSIWPILLCFGISTTIPNVICSQSREADPVISKNITYRVVNGAKLQLDLAQPAKGQGPFPAIIFVHGGGWRNGNRRAYTNEISNAATRGFVAVTVTYRLTKESEGVPAAAWPAQIHDVKCAVRWLKAHAKEYHVDPNRLGIFGESAGGHLSLMTALSDTTVKLEGTGSYSDHSSRVQAVVNFYGPTDMRKLYETSGPTRAMLEPLLGGDPKQAAEMYRQSSPVSYISKDDPPVLTYHGALDTLVPTEQAHLLDKKLKAAGVSHELHFVKQAKHGFFGESRKAPLEAMYSFFEKTLRNQSGVKKNNSEPAGLKNTRTQQKNSNTSASQERKTALWIFQQGGKLTVSINGRSGNQLNSKSQLPDSNFLIENVALNQNSKISDKELRQLSGLSGLKSLNLNSTKIGDSGIKTLQKNTKLETLGLFGTQVTNKGLKHLQNLKNLRSLILRNSRVTSQGVEELRKALPRCKIDF